MNPAISPRHAALSADQADRFLLLDALTPFLSDAQLIGPMRRLGLKPAAGAWKQDEPGRIRRGFSAAKQLFERGHLRPGARHELAVRAARDKEVVKAVREGMEHARDGYQDAHRRAAQAVMLAVYGDALLPGNLDDEEIVSTVGAILGAAPFTLEWFLDRPQPVRDHAFRAMLEDLLTSCRVWPAAAALMDAFDQGRYRPKWYNIVLFFALTFRGRPPSARDLEPFRPADAMTVVGLDQLLREDYEAALATQLEARKLWRKATRRRAAELPLFGSLILQTARLGANRDLPLMHRDCYELFREHSIRSGGGAGFFALLDMLAGRMTAPVEHDSEHKRNWVNQHLPRADLLSRLLHAHACVPREDKTWIPACVALRDALAPVLPPAAAILDDALAAAGMPTLGLDAPHPDFRRFIVTRAPWERQLEALTSLLTDRPKDKAAKTDKPKRLVWMLDTQSGEVYPKVQTCGAKGAWTSGQRFAVKRLMGGGEEELDWLSPQDRRMSAAYARYEYSYGGWDFIPERGLPLLCGHPLIFEERTGEHVSLEQRPVELVVTEKEDGCEVRLSADNEGYRRLVLRKVGEGAWAVLLFDQTSDAVGRLLAAGRKRGDEAVLMPREALPRLLDLAQRSSLPLRLDLEAEERAAEALPVVQLQQQGAGFAAGLYVRPLGNRGEQENPNNPDQPGDAAAAPLDAAGPIFRTGQGPADPMVVLAGRPVRLLRDFAAETAAADKLLAACPTLSADLEDGRWYTDDLEEFLQVLTELQGAAELCRVEWPKGRRLALAGTIGQSQVRVRAERGKAGDWFTLSGEVRVDEEHTLALGELLDRLAASRGRFVELAPGQFLALTEEARRGLKRLRLLASERKAGRGKKDKDQLLLHPLAGPAVDEACQGMDFERDAGWEAALGRMGEALSLKPETPRTLQADLRPYQKEGFVWLARLAHWGVGGCLADDMGLGKTVQTIAAMIREAPNGPCLVIAPTSVCPNWEAELARFAPGLAVRRLRDAASGGREAVVADMGPGMVLIAGYGLLHIERETLASRHWRMVVFDEAQALKNDAAKRTKAAAAIPADFRLALTGTPIENHLDDLWSLFNIINPGLLGGTHPEFHRRFGAAAQGGQSAGALKLLTRPFILRRLKSQVLDDLPPRTEQTILIEPDERERSFYEALRRRAVESLEARKEADGRSSRINILAELTRLRRACCHASLVEERVAGEVVGLDEESAKMRRFLDLLEEAREGGHRLLVFSQFVGFLTLVRAMLDKRNISYQYLDGSTPEEARRQRVAAFQAGAGDAFLISLKAGGQGLNLTAADYVVHLDPWWNPAVEDQATDRAHRIGQERPVTVYRLVVAHSVEEKILALHAKKRELAADFLEGADAAASGDTLSEEELLALMG